MSQLKNKSGKQLLKEYENLDKNTEDYKIELYKRAIIEKYANEIDYNSEKV